MTRERFEMIAENVADFSKICAVAINFILVMIEVPLVLIALTGEPGAAEMATIIVGSHIAATASAIAAGKLLDRNAYAGAFALGIIPIALATLVIGTTIWVVVR